MPEIDLGQMTPPDGEPDLLSFGGEPVGGADRLDLAGERRDPADQRGPRWLPAWWRDRPVPRSVVAVVSALVAGAAVAIYLEPQSGAPSDPPPEPARLLTPESWLDVADLADGLFFQPAEPEGPRVDAAVAEHPSNASLVLSFAENGSRLFAVPPDRYQVLVSCQLAVPPESIRDSVEFQIMLREGNRHGGDVVELTCDGELQTFHEQLNLPDYQAFVVEFFPTFLSPDGGDPGFLVEEAEPVVVVSFTKA